jgi:hypothetical protein
MLAPAAFVWISKILTNDSFNMYLHINTVNYFKLYAFKMIEKFFLYAFRYNIWKQTKLPLLKQLQHRLSIHTGEESIAFGDYFFG